MFTLKCQPAAINFKKHGLWAEAPLSVEEAAKQVKGLHLYPDFLSEAEGTWVLELRLFLVPAT